MQNFIYRVKLQAQIVCYSRHVRAEPRVVGALQILVSNASG